MSKEGKTDLSIVINRYAAAMLDLGENQGLLDVFNADLFLIKHVIETNEDLKEFIHHPLIKNQEKKEVLGEIFTDAVAEHTLNFIKLIADKNRLIILPYVADSYKKLLYEKRNIATAKVITAISIDENVLNRVREKLEKMFSKKIEVEASIDENIIAGMIIKIADQVIDGSIRTKIDNMKKQLC